MQICKVKDADCRNKTLQTVGGVCACVHVCVSVSFTRVWLLRLRARISGVGSQGLGLEGGSMA